MDKNNEKSFYSFREQDEDTCYGSFALELVSGNKCQLRCSNCYKHDDVFQLRNSDMPDSFVFDAIRQAKECGFAEIVIIGGEPTLHNSLPEFMEFILEMGLTPILVTNGIKLADFKYANKVALEGSTLVLHAPLAEAEVQDKHAGKNGYNKLLLQAYKNVLSKNVTVVGEITIINEFFPHLESVYQWCLNNGVIPFIEISRRDDKGNCYSGNISPENVKRLFETLRKIDPNSSGPLVPPAYGQPCTMPITGLHIKNFGNGNFGGVYSCCAQHIRHGDLKEQPLSEIIKKPSVKFFMSQDNWIAGPCKDCQYYSVCRGGCRGEAFLTYGCPRASYPCWYIPVDIRNNPSAMRPENCDGCPLQNNPMCQLLK